MKFISNEEMYKLARAGSTNFAQSTPESYEDFVHMIAGLNTVEARQLTNDFTSSLMMLFLNRVEGVNAKNTLDKNGLIERFYVPFKGIKENMYTRARRAINPKYKNKQDGSSVDMQLYTKPSTESIYYTFNDDYQNTISIPTDDIKTAVESENGLSMLVSGYMQGLASEYTIWEREHMFNVLNTMLNATGTKALKTSQIAEIEIADENNVTTDELVEFVTFIKNTVKAIGRKETTAFNIGSFPKYVESKDLVLLVKPGIETALETKVLPVAFHNDKLETNLEKIEVDNFGGLVPTSDGTLAGKLYMVYDAQGRPTDTYTTDEQGQTAYTGEVQWYDPNADVVAIIAEKGLLFIDEQNPYEVGAAPYNYAGRYVTYWANKPNVGFHYDMYKVCVVIKKK